MSYLWIIYICRSLILGRSHSSDRSHAAYRRAYGLCMNHLQSPVTYSRAKPLTGSLPRYLSESLCLIYESSTVAMQITFEHRAFLCNTYVKNKIHTRNAVINSEENFLVCLFEPGQKFTIILKYFRQQAPFQAVLEHRKDTCQLRKINKNSMLDWRHFQENHWIASATNRLVCVANTKCNKPLHLSPCKTIVAQLNIYHADG